MQHFKSWTGLASPLISTSLRKGGIILMIPPSIWFWTWNKRQPTSKDDHSQNLSPLQFQLYIHTALNSMQLKNFIYFTSMTNLASLINLTWISLGLLESPEERENMQSPQRKAQTRVQPTSFLLIIIALPNWDRKSRTVLGKKWFAKGLASVLVWGEYWKTQYHGPYWINTREHFVQYFGTHI